MYKTDNILVTFWGICLIVCILIGFVSPGLAFALFLSIFLITTLLTWLIGALIEAFKGKERPSSSSLPENSWTPSLPINDPPLVPTSITPSATSGFVYISEEEYDGLLNIRTLAKELAAGSSEGVIRLKVITWIISNLDLSRMHSGEITSLWEHVADKALINPNPDISWDEIAALIPSPYNDESYRNPLLLRAPDYPPTS